MIDKEHDVTSNQDDKYPLNIVQEESSISEKDKSTSIEAIGFKVNVAEANTENEAIPQFISESVFSSTAKGKEKQKEKEIAGIKQITRRESAKKRNEKEIKVSKISNAAQTEGVEISAQPVQSSLQASSSKLIISLASGSKIFDF